MALRRAVNQTIHPDLLEYAQKRGASVQNRIADGITAFAGSMPFVYLHIAWFAAWLVFQPFHDTFPFGLLTMMVSLEAIFLSTFVMISQNRADERRQVIADHQWEQTEQEWKENDEILSLSRQVLELTRELHVLTRQVHAAVSAR